MLLEVPERPDLPSYVLGEIFRRLYRWSRANAGLTRRLHRLQGQLLELPRRAVGTLVRDIDPALDARLAKSREPDRELVIGDFDQDGGILPRFGTMAGVPSISSEQFMPRSGCPVRLVDLNGRLGVRKEFRTRGRFIQELEALVHLERCRCPIPGLMNVDWDAPSVTTVFIPGGVVRELLAEAGADVRDRDSKGPYTRSRDKERIRSGRKLIPSIMSQGDIEHIASALAAIHSAGFVLEDVKYGNIILRAGTGEPIFIDLERALPIAGVPAMFARYLRHIDLRKFREQFGDLSLEERCAT